MAVATSSGGILLDGMNRARAVVSSSWRLYSQNFKRSFEIRS